MLSQCLQPSDHLLTNLGFGHLTMTQPTLGAIDRQSLDAQQTIDDGHLLQAAGIVQARIARGAMWLEILRKFTLPLAQEVGRDVETLSYLSDGEEVFVHCQILYIEPALCHGGWVN